MKNVVVVRGTLMSTKVIELDEPVDAIVGPVEVVLRPLESGEAPRRDVFDLIASMRPGHLSKAEIDERLARARAS